MGFISLIMENKVSKIIKKCLIFLAWKLSDFSSFLWLENKLIFLARKPANFSLLLWLGNELFMENHHISADFWLENELVLVNFIAEKSDFSLYFG